MPASRPRTNWTASASASSPAACRRSTTAPAWLTEAERAALEAEGRKPHWRFRLANTEDGLAPLPTIVSWNDLIRGDQTVDVGSLSDPVLIRADGTFLYTFTSVVDDADFAITHIIRGEDHVTNTRGADAAVRSAGRRPPAFGHHSLLIGADGQALSKRLGELSIESFREAGLEPMAVVSQRRWSAPRTPSSRTAASTNWRSLFALDKISPRPAASTSTS